MLISALVLALAVNFGGAGVEEFQTKEDLLTSDSHLEMQQLMYDPHVVGIG